MTKFWTERPRKEAGKPFVKFKPEPQRKSNGQRTLGEKVLPKGNKRQKNKVDWVEPKPFVGKNPSKGQRRETKKKTAGFEAESFLPTPSEEESQL